jgi:hypothetical protein
MVVTDDADSPDYDEQYDAAFVCTTEDQDAIVLFTNIEIIINNEACKSFFYDDIVFTTITTPFYNGGIDSSSKASILFKTV